MLVALCDRYLVGTRLEVLGWAVSQGKEKLKQLKTQKEGAIKRVVMLTNLYDLRILDLEAWPDLFLDQMDDMVTEAMAQGRVESVLINRYARFGCWIKYSQERAARRCQAALDEKWMLGQTIVADLRDEQDWEEVLRVHSDTFLSRTLHGEGNPIKPTYRGKTTDEWKLLEVQQEKEELGSGPRDVRPGGEESMLSSQATTATRKSEGSGVKETTQGPPLPTCAKSPPSAFAPVVGPPKKVTPPAPSTGPSRGRDLDQGINK